MKMTLLDITQNILSALDSDEVNSITDTVESMQVAEVVKETFYELFSNVIVPEQNSIIALEGLADITRPNYLVIPSNVTDISWVRYVDERNRDKYKPLKYLDNDEFLRFLLEYTPDAYHITAVEDVVSGATFYIKNNSAPTYYTIFNDKYLVFDSYDKEYDDTLHESKVIAFGRTESEFLLEDSYVPPIDSNLFPLLLSEAKSTCFVNLKQISSAKEENKSRRQRIRWQRNKYKSSYQNGTHKSWNFSRNRW